MSKRSLKKWALLLTFWLALHTSALHATTILAGTSPAIIEMDTNGLLDDIGTYGTGTLSLSGAGTRMIWYPGKAAFRAGSIDSNYLGTTLWDDANVGIYSVAFGRDTKASGNFSTASGIYSVANGLAATAFGGSCTASGVVSTAMGIWTTASGTYSTSFGEWTIAGARDTMAFGRSTLASGNYATAFGLSTTASGTYSTAAGTSVTAGSYDSFVVGTYNVNKTSSGGTVTATSWVSTDPLFEIGNGTYSTHADALVVYKNGNTTVNGNLTVNGSISSTLTSLALLPSASATGTDAVALGKNTLASGNYGFANGSNSTASGTYAAAAGYHTTAASYDSFVVGTYNTGGGTTNSWVSTDPLFEIGNGTSGTHSDALSVDKSGNEVVKGNITSGGVITAQPGGDIPMYSGM